MIPMDKNLVEALLSKALERNRVDFLNLVCKLTFLQIYLFNFLHEIKPLDCNKLNYLYEG